MGTGGTPALQSPKAGEWVVGSGKNSCHDHTRNRLETGHVTGLSYHPRPTTRFLNIDGAALTAEPVTCVVSTVHFMVKPNGLLVTVSSTYYYAYTSVLSTW